MRYKVLITRNDVKTGRHAVTKVNSQSGGIKSQKDDIK